MTQLSLLLLAVCVGAVMEYVASKKVRDQVPPYLTYLTNSQVALAAVKSLTNATSELPVTDYRRQYVLLAAVVFRVADDITLPCHDSYENLFLSVVDKEVPVGWQKPETVHEKFLSLEKAINGIIEPINVLIKEKCFPKDQNQVGDICSQLVHTEVLKDPKKYDRPVQLLTAAGDASHEYWKDTYETSARKYKIVDLLVTDGQKKLKSLVKKMAELLLIVYERAAVAC